MAVTLSRRWHFVIERLPNRARLRRAIGRVTAWPTPFASETNARKGVVPRATRTTGGHPCFHRSPAAMELRPYGTKSAVYANPSDPDGGRYLDAIANVPRRISTLMVARSRRYPAIEGL